MDVSFSKYQAAGNDFILIDGFSAEIAIGPKQIKKLCDRNLGIGADGLIIARPSEKADLFMDYYNADGSLAEMCGNGVRALADFYISNVKSQMSNVIVSKAKQSLGLPRRPSHDMGGTPRNDISVETRAGIKTIKVENGLYKVDMGKASFSNKDIGFDSDKPMWAYPLEITPTGRHPERERRISEPIEIYGASMGNPHCIIFTDDIENAPVKELGPAIEINPLFKNRINVEWVQVNNNEKISVKVWERGAGSTLSCGTGACAAFAVASKLGFVKNKAVASLPGGDLQVEWAGENLLLTGPAKKVFEGSIKIATP